MGQSGLLGILAIFTGLPLPSSISVVIKDVASWRCALELLGLTHVRKFTDYLARPYLRRGKASDSARECRN